MYVLNVVEDYKNSVFNIYLHTIIQYKIVINHLIIIKA